MNIDTKQQYYYSTTNTTSTSKYYTNNITSNHNIADISSNRTNINDDYSCIQENVLEQNKLSMPPPPTINKYKNKNNNNNKDKEKDNDNDKSVNIVQKNKKNGHLRVNQKYNKEISNKLSMYTHSNINLNTNTNTNIKLTSINNNILQKIKAKTNTNTYNTLNSYGSDPSHRDRIRSLMSNTNLNYNNNHLYQQQRQKQAGGSLSSATCNIFQNKVRIKRSNSKNGSHNNNQSIYNQNNDSKYNVYDQEVGDNGLSFAEQYRLNLRKTVYNETKMMMKKKNKQRRLVQTIDYHKNNSGIFQQNTSKELPYTKPTLHNFRSRHNSQKLSNNNADTMYKTIVELHPTVSENQLLAQKICSQLDISKFPVISKNKEANHGHHKNHEENVNYSNLLNTLNMRETLLKEKQQVKGRFKMKRKFGKNFHVNKDSSRGSSQQKHEIKPWETFADQFYD